MPQSLGAPSSLRREPSTDTSSVFVLLTYLDLQFANSVAGLFASSVADGAVVLTESEDY